MGFTSIDDFVNQITVNAKRVRRDMSKVTTPVHTAGGWHSLPGLAGFPNAGTYPGTDLLFQSCWETSGDGTVVICPQIGGIPGGAATKHLLGMSGMMVAAAGAPWALQLVDLQGYYRLSGTNVTGTGSRTLINANTFTASNSGGDLLLTYTNDFNTLTKVRFTTTTTLPTGLSLNTDYYLVRQSATTAKVSTTLANAIAGTFIAFTDAGSGTHTLTIQMRAPLGAGVEAFFVVQTAPTAGGPNLSASSYTNEGGTAGRAFQASPTMGAAADAYACRILHSGNAAGRQGAYLPKQGADAGIRSIESFTWSGGTAYTGSGVVALCLARPLTDPIILPATGVEIERDFLTGKGALPKVEDGACIVPILFGTGATTNNSPLTYSAEVGWGG